MIISEAVRTSLEEVRAHKLRSVLTLAGVVLGTTALVIVISVLGGVTKAVWAGFDDLGLDGVLIISAKEPSDRINRAKAHYSRGLRVEDQEYLRAGVDGIREMTSVGETRAVITGGSTMRRITVYGVMPNFAQIKNRKVTEGRFIGQRDQSGVAPVVVLGHKLKEQLFGGESPIGQQVTVQGRRLTVVGVGTKFNMEFVDDDQMRQETGGVYVPFSIYETMFGRNAVSYVIAKAVDPARSVETEGDVKRLYARAHRGVEDVKINNVAKEILKSRGEVDVILKNWLIVFVSIAGISLLIGGVGIFSVLKISISERLYEIGLRKSIGASDGEIFFQFLIESMTLSLVGALSGALFGCAVVLFISTKFPAGLSISVGGLIAASGFALVIGLFAGLYPSLTAARMQPVDALRA